MAAGYYRFPTIYDDTIVFVSEDDLWAVAVHGGVARRLTSNLGEVTYPMFSPDGAWLAFVGREEGASEVYVMPADGGSARRLTYLSSSCRVLGWTADGAQIIFASNYGQVSNREFAIHRVEAASSNGLVTQLPYGPAQSIAFGPQGQVVLGRNMGDDPAHWKRYRGGTAGHLWIDRNGDGQFARFLSELKGNIASPMWLIASAPALLVSGGRREEAGRIFFASDHEGIGNLYSCRPNGQDLRRHTDHEDYYVRNPTTDGKRIVYHVGADLYVYDVATDREQYVEVDTRSPRVQRNRRFVDPGRYFDSATLHPSGRAMALTTRGKTYVFYNHDGPVLQLGKRDGVRYRLPDWLNETRGLVLISDELGEETLEIHNTDPDAQPRRLEGLDLGRAVELKVSPVQDKVALSNHRNELLLVDIATGELALVDRSPFRLISGFDWSPDGRWLAYGFSATAKTTAIRLYRLPDPDAEDEALQRGAIYTITRPVLRDVRPAFDPDGKYLYFLSYREFNPVYDRMHFDLSFPWGVRPYLVTLRADLTNPFVPRPDLEEDEGASRRETGGEEKDKDDENSPQEKPEDEGDEEREREEGDESDDEDADEDKDGDDEGEEDEESSQRLNVEAAQLASQSAPDNPTGTVKAAPDQPKKPQNGARRLQIDLDGIEQRVVAFPVPDGRYGAIAGIAGKALFTDFPLRGSLGSDEAWDDEPPETGTLRCYHFKEYKTEALADNVSWFEISRNGKKLLYGSNWRLRVINAGEKPPNESGHPRRTGWIDFSRIKVSVNPQSEWEQMFREAWRLQRDHFWTEDMSQVDWQTVYQRYFPLIQRVSTRSEISDLMWEMQGELGTSHAYEYGGDYRPRPYYGQGFLGAQFAWDAAARGYRVGALLVGDPWDARTTSPLASPGTDVQLGDVLLAINGQRLSETVGPPQLLVNQAGNELLLTFAPRQEIADFGLQIADSLTGSTAQEGILPVDRVSTSSTKEEEAASTTTSADSGDRDGNPIQNAQRAPESKIRNRNVVVRALSGEAPARYRAWVERNRRRVYESTNGRVGYVHIPDMGARGYAEFHRSYLAEIDRDALIVDVRYNSGGHVSELLLEKLARRRIGYDLSRWGGLVPYPTDSVAGPLVALTNEHAASDGDIFCHGFKLLKLGPLIGKRTWGGVIGYSPRQALVDGTVTTQPEYSHWFVDVGWSIENYGTDPDIEVDFMPQDYVAGHDPQLERAITEVLRLLEEQPIRKPDLTQRPNRALPKLPPRRLETEDE